MLLVAGALFIACSAPEPVDSTLAEVDSRSKLRVEAVSLTTAAPLPDVVVLLHARQVESHVPTRAQAIERERVCAHALSGRAGHVCFSPDPGVDLWVRVDGRPGVSVGDMHAVEPLQLGESRNTRFVLLAPQ